MDRSARSQTSRSETRKEKSQESSRAGRIFSTLGTGAILLGASMAQGVGGLSTSESARSAPRLTEHNNLSSRLNESSLVSSDTTTNRKNSLSRDYLRSRSESVYSSQRTFRGEISQPTTDNLSSSRETLQASDLRQEISGRGTAHSLRTGHHGESRLRDSLSLQKELPSLRKRHSQLAASGLRHSEAFPISGRETAHSFSRRSGQDGESSARDTLSYKDMKEKALLSLRSLRGRHSEFPQPAASDFEHLLQSEKFRNDIRTTLSKCQENPKFAENILTLAKQQDITENIRSMAKNEYFMNYIREQSQNPEFKKLVDSIRPQLDAKEVEGLTHNLNTNIEMSERSMRKLLNVEETHVVQSTNKQDTGLSKQTSDKVVEQSVNNSLAVGNMFVCTSLVLLGGTVGFLLHDRRNLNATVNKQRTEILSLMERNHTLDKGKDELYYFLNKEKDDLSRDKDELNKEVDELKLVRNNYADAYLSVAPHLRPALSQQFPEGRKLPYFPPDRSPM
jgi:ribosomal protein L17